jgi:hypothetical protein
MLGLQMSADHSIRSSDRLIFQDSSNLGKLLELPQTVATGLDQNAAECGRLAEPASTDRSQRCVYG